MTSLEGGSASGAPLMIAPLSRSSRRLIRWREVAICGPVWASICLAVTLSGDRTVAAIALGSARRSHGSKASPAGGVDIAYQSGFAGSLVWCEATGQGSIGATTGAIPVPAVGAGIVTCVAD
jgi:hypothetical protein